MNIYIRKSFTFLRLIWGAIRYPVFRLFVKVPQIMSIDETLDFVINKNTSVARFGDSEYLYMTGKGDGIQQADVDLKNKLRQSMQNPNPKLLVCMVNYHDLKGKTLFAKMSAMMFHVNTFNKYKPYINYNYKFGNSNMTRFNMGSKDKSRSKERFEKCKLIWQNREIVIFEGVNTRFGLGNDLFDNAASIKRVLCPSKGAFEKYTEIIAKAKEFDKTSLLIFALGATATVLASEMTNEGYQAIDIGNLDVEYEWFKRGVTRKVALENKQVSEVSGGTKVVEITDKKYLSEIVCKIL